MPFGRFFPWFKTHKRAANPLMNSKELYFRLLGYVRPHARVFALSMVGTMAAAATEPLIPALIQPLLDGSFVEKDPRTIQLMPVLQIGRAHV